MIIPPGRDMCRSSARVRSAPGPGRTSPCTVPVPSRLRNSRSAGDPGTLPAYMASQPHGWSAISISTANGSAPDPFCSKYQAWSGTSYSAVTALPACIPPSGPSTAITLVMKWSGPGPRSGLDRSRAAVPGGARRWQPWPSRRARTRRAPHTEQPGRLEPVRGAGRISVAHDQLGLRRWRNRPPARRSPSHQGGRAASASPVRSARAAMARATRPEPS